MDITKYIDFTLLNPGLRSDEVIDLCNNAIKYNIKYICVSPSYVMLAKELLKNRNISIVTVIGFPLGSSTNIVKLMEAKDALEKGADELDVVINIGALKDGKIQYVLNELQAIKKISSKKIVKCVIEASILSREEIVTASKIALNSGVDFVQDSTGFFGFVAEPKNIKLIKEVVGDQLKIKSVGGISTYNLAAKVIKAGASRIGTSNPLRIYNSENKRIKKLIKKNKK